MEVLHHNTIAECRKKVIKNTKNMFEIVLEKILKIFLVLKKLCLTKIDLFDNKFQK